MMRQRRLSFPSVVLGIAVALCSSVLAQDRIGGEFQVNTYTSSSQATASVATDADGDFVIAWQSNQDGQGFGVFAQRFSSDGVTLGGEFQVNTFTAGVQRQPAAAMDADGDFVVAWEGSLQDGSEYGVFAQRFSSAGVALAIEFQVNTHTVNTQLRPSIAADSDGDIVVVWRSLQQDSHLDGVFGRRFSSDGVALGGEFQVNTYTYSNQSEPAVDANANGDFVVAWESSYQVFLGDPDTIVAQRFSSAGVAQGSEIHVNAHTPLGQRVPAVAVDSDGDFVITWVGYYGPASTDTGVFARRFSSAGDPLGGDFQVNTYTTLTQRFPSVAVDASGTFTIAWHSPGDGFGDGIFARRFSGAGAALGGQFLVSTFTQSQETFPSVAVESDGAFVVAWQTNGKEAASNYGVSGQRFGAPDTATLDVDGNGMTDALTDGLLVLRSQFGFTGTALTNGAVGAPCTRCDAAAIEPYLTGLGMVLDIDDDGELGALTDGLLVVRFLFGFTGTSLTANAVGDGCDTRCNAAAIESYLAGLD